MNFFSRYAIKISIKTSLSVLFYNDIRIENKASRWIFISDIKTRDGLIVWSMILISIDQQIWMICFLYLSLRVCRYILKSFCILIVYL